MDRLYEESLLFDFYGDLLTDRQRQIFEEVVLNDYSLAEVAKEEEISRQGVHDLIRRTRSALEEYEEKLHLVERFLKIRNNVEEIRRISDSDKILALTEEILEVL